MKIMGFFLICMFKYNMMDDNESCVNFQDSYSMCNMIVVKLNLYVILTMR